MGWKDWSSWLKGGIIVTILYAIYSIISVLISILFPKLISGSSLIENLIFFPQVLGMYLVIFKSGFNFIESKLSFTQYFEIFIIGIIFYFLIGAVIGWIFGKMKKK